MVRRSGRTPRSSSRRRTYRAKAKYSYLVTPRRFKFLREMIRPNLDDNLEFELRFYQELEDSVFSELGGKGVDPETYKYYLAFCDRLVAQGLKFWDETFLKEKQALIYEFTERGLDLSVLDNIQLIAEALVEERRGMVVFEGNYSTYSEIRRTTALRLGADYISHNIDRDSFCGNEYAYIVDIDMDLAIVKLSDASFTFHNDAFEHAGIVQYGDASLLGRYFAYSRLPDYNYIDVFKNGVLIVSLPVDDVVNDMWMSVLVSPNGKYIVGLHRDVSEPAVDEMTAVIFEGS